MATKKLHTFLALRDGAKTRHQKDVTAAHRRATREDLYEGLTRTYRPKDEDGDQLPSETRHVQLNADRALQDLVDAVSADWNLMATVDRGDQDARADVRVPAGRNEDGTVVYRTILRDVPATYLLYLARELDDVRKYVDSVPTLDSSVPWHYDANVAAHVTDAVSTHRTQKVATNHIKWVPTPGNDKHPAQVEVRDVDTVVGYWSLVRRSGALPLERKLRLLQRVDALRQAVREAREDANDTEVDDVEVARHVFDFLYEED